MITGFLPCGACGSYVSRLTGCRHWKPRQQEYQAQARIQASRDLVERMAGTGKATRRPDPSLSPRNLEIITEYARGALQRELADRYGMSVSRVQQIVARGLRLSQSC